MVAKCLVRHNNWVAQCLVFLRCNNVWGGIMFGWHNVQVAGYLGSRRYDGHDSYTLRSSLDSTQGQETDVRQKQWWQHVRSVKMSRVAQCQGGIMSRVV